LAHTLEGLRGTTELDRKTFLNYVSDEIHSNLGDDRKLSKRDHTLPKVIAFYLPKIGAQRLESAATKVAERHSRIH
jgi:hypothetical protein